MLAITIALFVVPHNQQIVTIRQFFTYRIPLFRNQNLNIQKKTISFRKLPIYNKKPMSLRKGIGFCQQSERFE